MNNESPPRYTRDSVTTFYFIMRRVSVSVCLVCGSDDLWTLVIIITNCDLWDAVSWIAHYSISRINSKFMAGIGLSPQMVR